MKSNNFINTAIDDYYLNPYKCSNTFFKNKEDIKYIGSNDNLNLIIKRLTSIIMSESDLSNFETHNTSSKNNELDTNFKSVSDNKINLDKFIIFKLVANNNMHELKKLLESNDSFDINMQDNDGDTALHIAIFLSNYDACNILINHGANLYIKDKWEQTPVHRLCFALENKNISKIIDLINENQEKIYKSNKMSKHFDKNIFNNTDKYKNTPLHLIIKYILKNKFKLNKNIISTIDKLLSLTNIDLINTDGLSVRDLINMIQIQ